MSLLCDWLVCWGLTCGRMVTVMWVPLGIWLTEQRSTGISLQHGGTSTIIVYSLISSSLLLYTYQTPLATCVLLPPGAITLTVPSLITASLLVHTYHPTGDLPSLVTRCLHSHCLFSSNLFSPLIHPTGDLPSLVTRCNHYQCPFFFNLLNFLYPIITSSLSL